MNWTNVLKFARSLAIDSSIVAGVALVTYGTMEINKPAGFIVLGAMLLAGGVRATR